MRFQRSTRSSPPRLPLLSQRLGAAQTTGAAEGADAADFIHLHSGGKDVTLKLNFALFLLSEQRRGVQHRTFYWNTVR